MSFPQSSPPRRHGNSISVEVERRLVLLWRDGVEPAAICERLGLARSVVYKYAETHGLVPPRMCPLCGSLLRGARPHDGRVKHCQACLALLQLTVAELAAEVVALRKRLARVP